MDVIGKEIIKCTVKTWKSEKLPINIYNKHIQWTQFHSVCRTQKWQQMTKAFKE